MDTLAYLVASALLCFYPLIWFPIVGLLYYAILYKAENPHIYAFLRHTKLLQNLFSEKKDGFNLLSFFTTDPYGRNHLRIPNRHFFAVAVPYIFCLICYTGFLLLASGFVLQNVDNGLGIIFIFIIILISALLCGRLLLFGRNLKKFVKHKN
jgi:hypothetical protein